MDGMEQLAAAVDRLAGADLSDRDGAELAEELPVFRRLIDRLEAEWLRRAVAFDVSGVWHADGASSAAAWIAARCTSTDGAALRRAIATVAALESLPAASAALAAGDIGLGHAHQLAEAAGDAVRRGAREADAPLIDPDDEAALVDAAKRTDARGLRQIIRSFQDSADATAGVERARRQYTRRQLRMWTRPDDGMGCLAGALTPDAAAYVSAAVEALRRQGSTPEDRRSLEQQRADALVELCKGFLDGPAPGAGPQAGSQGGGERPHVSVIIDLAALQARWDGDARAASPPRPGHGPTGGLLGNGERICSQTARRICCDAGVSRVLTGPGPAILEFGRSRRTTSRSQRRYLDLRDGGCVFPHCGKSPALCDAHHLIFWADQDHPGDTDVDNLALLCWAHHVAVHEGGWTLQRLPDHGGWQVTRGAVINAWAGPPNRHGASSTANAASAPTSPPHTGVSHHHRPTRSDDGDTARSGRGGPTRAPGRSTAPTGRRDTTRPPTPGEREPPDPVPRPAAAQSILTVPD